MSRLVDEDGIDGPFERAMRRAEAQDRRDAVMLANHGRIVPGATYCDCSKCKQRPPRRGGRS